jgi:Ner family transcriptional regulator
MARTRKQPPKWHKEDIKAAIRKQGETLVSLARKKGLTETCVRNALRTPLPCGERVISDFLGIPLHELWPERWTSDGQRIRPRYAHK